MLSPPAATSTAFEMLLTFDLAEIKVLFGRSGFGPTLSELTGSKAIYPRSRRLPRHSLEAR